MENENNTNNEVTRQIVNAIRSNTLSPNQCAEIFMALSNQKHVVGGSMYTSDGWQHFS